MQLTSVFPSAKLSSAAIFAAVFAHAVSSKDVAAQETWPSMEATVISAAIAARSKEEALFGWQKYVSFKQETEAPYGHKIYCKRNPADCEPTAPVNGLFHISDALYEKMTAENIRINDYPYVIDEYTSGEDPDAKIPDPKNPGKFLYEIWRCDIDELSGGDCEDSACGKWKIFEALGVPPGAMSIAHVITETGEHHAVLIVRSDRGDLIFDNRTDEVLTAGRTGYTFVAATIFGDYGKWQVVAELSDSGSVGTINLKKSPAGPVVIGVTPPAPPLPARKPIELAPSGWAAAHVSSATIEPESSNPLLKMFDFILN